MTETIIDVSLTYATGNLFLQVIKPGVGSAAFSISYEEAKKLNLDLVKEINKRDEFVKLLIKERDK